MSYSIKNCFIFFKLFYLIKTFTMFDQHFVLTDERTCYLVKQFIVVDKNISLAKGLCLSEQIILFYLLKKVWVK